MALYKLLPEVGPNLTPEGYNSNNLGRSPQDEATYQISKALAF